EQTIAIESVLAVQRNKHFLSMYVSCTCSNVRGRLRPPLSSAASSPSPSQHPSWQLLTSWPRPRADTWARSDGNAILAPAGDRTTCGPQLSLSSGLTCPCPRPPWISAQHVGSPRLLSSLDRHRPRRLPCNPIPSYGSRST